MADLQITISQQACNDATSAVFAQLGGTSAFSGSGTDTNDDIDYTWQITQAPQFDLSPSAQDAARQFYVPRIQHPEHLQADYYQGLQEYLATGPAFQVILPVVQLQFTISGTKGQPFDIVVTVNCELDSGDGTISIKTTSATETGAPDPFTKQVIDEYILPDILKSQTKILSNITLPPVSWNGINFGAPSVDIQGSAVVISFNLLNGKKVAEGPALPESGQVSVTISAALLQAAVQANIGSLQFSDSGEADSDPFFADYHYSLCPDNPQVGIGDGQVLVYLSLEGGVGANVGLKLKCKKLSVGVDLGAKAEPNPFLTFEVSCDGNDIKVRTVNVSPVAVIVYPTGNVASWITGWFLSILLTAVSSTIVNQFTPLLSAFKFTVGKVPSFSLPVADQTFTIQPQLSSFAVSGDYLVGTGSFQVTVSSN